MSGADRRTAVRYVLGDLVLEINGLVHDTVDISTRSVAVVARSGIDYADRRMHARFTSARVPELNREIVSLAVTGLRRSLAIFDYAVDDAAWEAKLKQHDVANDTPVLQDIFG
jgi:hypothetical protein